MVINEQCVENKDLPILVSKLTNSLKDYLRKLKGLKECGKEIKDQISVSTAVNWMQEQFKGTKFLEESIEELRF